MNSKTKITAVLSAFLAATALAQQPAQPKGRGPGRPAFVVTSTSFEDGGVIPNKYSASDPNPVSPKLDWINAPATAVTFALIMHDQDVALRRTVDDNLHWLIFNIPGTATGLPEDVPATATLPDGTVQAKCYRGTPGYGPPAAGPGPFHHYAMEVFALDTKLDLGPDATRADVIKAMDGHVVGKSTITYRYHR